MEKAQLTAVPYGFAVSIIEHVTGRRAEKGVWVRP